MRAVVHQAFHEVRRPRLFLRLCVIGIVMCLLCPTDLQSYRTTHAPDGAAVVSDHYTRFASALAGVALPLVLRDPVGLVQLACVALSTTVATHGLKHLVDPWVIWGTRLGERPSGPLSRYNMPSGHASMASSALYFVTRRYGWIHLVYLLPLLVLTMYARVALNAHTVTAVIAGALVGLVMAALFTSRRTGHPVPVEAPESRVAAWTPGSTEAR